MNPLVRHFVPSIVRGFHRENNDFFKIKNSQELEKFVQEKLRFIPRSLADSFKNQLANDFETVKNQYKMPDGSIDSKGLNKKINLFFQRHPYFDNALKNNEDNKESNNYLEIHFVRKILGPLLDNSGLLLVEPQRKIGSHQVDFAIQGASKFAIEVDGFGKFKQRSDLDDFIQRQNYIASQGWRVIRFTYNQIMRDTETTLKLLYSLFNEDVNLCRYLAVRRNIRTDPGLNLFDPQLIDAIDNFYRVQDWFVENALSFEQNAELIRLKDNFGFSIPLLALAISDLYKFLDTVQSVVNVDFDLPKCVIINNDYNYSLKWKKSIHYLVAISDIDNSNAQTVNAEIVSIKPATLPAPIISTETVKFRKNLTLEQIHDRLDYFTGEIFGYSSGTKKFQDSILQRIFNEEHILGISATGSGKSFCFWLPALLKPGLTLIICPLRSLMRDQHLTLRNYGISSVEFINSDGSVLDLEFTPRSQIHTD